MSNVSASSGSHLSGECNRRKFSAFNFQRYQPSLVSDADLKDFISLTFSNPPLRIAPGILGSRAFDHKLMSKTKSDYEISQSVRVDEDLRTHVRASFGVQPSFHQVTVKDKRRLLAYRKVLFEPLVHPNWEQFWSCRVPFPSSDVSASEAEDSKPSEPAKRTLIPGPRPSLSTSSKSGEKSLLSKVENTGINSLEKGLTKWEKAPSFDNAANDNAAKGQNARVPNGAENENGATQVGAPSESGDERAATKVQALHRGRQDRKELDEKKDAAQKIQAIHRGNAERQRSKEANSKEEPGGLNNERPEAAPPEGGPQPGAKEGSQEGVPTSLEEGEPGALNSKGPSYSFM